MSELQGEIPHLERFRKSAWRTVAMHAHFKPCPPSPPQSPVTPLEVKQQAIKEPAITTDSCMKPRSLPSPQHARHVEKRFSTSSLLFFLLTREWERGSKGYRSALQTQKCRASPGSLRGNPQQGHGNGVLYLALPHSAVETFGLPVITAEGWNWKVWLGFTNSI